MNISNFYTRHYEMISYIIFGVVTTTINVGSFFIFDTIIGWSYLFANGLSIVLSILFAFYVNKKYVFRVKANSLLQVLKEFGLFVLFRGFSASFDMLSMWLLIGGMGLNNNISKLLTEGVVVVLNFLISKFIIFKKNDIEEDEK